MTAKKKPPVETAYQFGLRHHSCRKAMIWRESLGNKTQADAWRECTRGDWLLWQWSKLKIESREREHSWPAIERAMTKIINRAIRRGLKAIKKNHKLWALKYREWAQAWLDGSNRSKKSAAAMWDETWRASLVMTGTEVAEAAVAEAAVAAAETMASCIKRAAAASILMEAAEAVCVVAVKEGTSEASTKKVQIKELARQAKDIHSELPEWPGEL